MATVTLLACVVWLLHAHRYYSGTALNLFLKSPFIYLANSKVESPKCGSISCVLELYIPLYGTSFCYLLFTGAAFTNNVSLFF
jgi:hypothetical protein